MTGVTDQAAMEARQDAGETAGESAGQGVGQGVGKDAEKKARQEWRRHGNYVLALLFLVSVFSILDRYILSILFEPIKHELGVSDTAMGFLNGLVFAIFNAAAIIPLARLSDRYSRRMIIAVGLVAWSILTALQGLARSFTALAIARIGVGIGEATTSPAAHSLIADYFPINKRATAISIFTTGGHVGLMLGLAAGGILYEWLGWRMTLVAVGLPGIALAVLVMLTVREPDRGANGRPPLSDAALDIEAEPEPVPQLNTLQALKYLWGIRTYRHIAIVLPLFVFTNYAINIWGAVFMIRVHQWSIAEVGVSLGLTVGLCGMAGNIIGSNLCDRLGERDSRWYLWCPTLAALLMLPLYACFLFIADPVAALVLLGVSIFLISFHVSPIYALAQGLVNPNSRATASAQIHLLAAVIAAGIGPFLIGVINDMLDPVWGRESVRYSLLLVVPSICWGAWHALRASRTVKQDLEQSQQSVI